MRRSKRVLSTVQLLNSNDEVVDAGAVGAVFPFAAVADAVDFLVEAKGATRRNISLGELAFRQ